jgi:hypothetical protein
VSEKGKTKSLIQAYHVAAEGHGLEHFKTMLADHQKAMQEDQERREAREAAKTGKPDRGDKKKRKSEIAEEDEDVDMEDEEEEAKSPPKKASKKRKKEVESDAEEEKVRLARQQKAYLNTDSCDSQPAKTPKTATKLKLTTPKAPGTSEKKAPAKTAKPKGDRKKSKAAISDEEAGEEEVKEPEKELDPAEAKAKKEKEGIFAAAHVQINAYTLQFSSYDTNFRKAFWLAIRLRKKAKWRPCRISSANWKTTATWKLASSARPRSTKC